MPDDNAELIAAGRKAVESAIWYKEDNLREAYKAYLKPEDMAGVQALVTSLKEEGALKHDVAINTENSTVMFATADMQRFAIPKGHIHGALPSTEPDAVLAR